ncbi:uncharacterized protein LOC136074425 [Hydra vulgaris]|uniref:Uncharacterized protein LOC136074425 n=1 Tax=Hydra vulgaris TaxID=6087 RepID=A0ABM4B218_HYDVU
MYNILSATTKRWQIFESKCCKLTVKSLSTTRWESHVNAVRALKFESKEIYCALKEVVNIEKVSITKLTAESLASKLENFEFICGVAVWHDVLTKINCTSKLLQSQTAYAKTAANALKKTINFFVTKHTEDSYKIYTSKAKILANDANLNDEFSSISRKRVRKRKRFFDDVPFEEDVIYNQTKKFKKQFFDVLFKIAKESINEQFESFSSTIEPFEFVYGIKDIDKIGEEDIINKYRLLEKVLTHGESKDVYSEDFFLELNLLSRKLDGKKLPESVLKWIYDCQLEELFPNVCISLRILTLPVTVSTGERSFSKLKLIKSYLQSTMGQERLNDLSIISIENIFVESVDIDTLRLNFAKSKVRHVPFSN